MSATTDPLQATRGALIPPEPETVQTLPPEALALQVVGRRWALLIINALLPGPLRPSALLQAVPGLSTESMRTRLGELEAAGIIVRSRFRELPPRVECELTDAGRDLAPVLAELAAWWGRNEQTITPAAPLRARTRQAKPLAPEYRDLLIRLWNDGRSGRDIAEKLSEKTNTTITVRQVYARVNHLRRSGYELRLRSPS